MEEEELGALLKNGQIAYVEQEELREYGLTEAQFSVIEGYLSELAESEGLAVKIGEPAAYYISQEAYGRAIVALLDEEGEKRILRVIGDSITLGLMKANVEEGLEEILMERTNLRTERRVKAMKGVEDMNFH